MLGSINCFGTIADSDFVYFLSGTDTVGGLSQLSSVLDFTVSVFDEVEADKSVDRRSLVWLSRGRCEKFGVLGEGLMDTTSGLKGNMVVLSIENLTRLTFLC